MFDLGLVAVALSDRDTLTYWIAGPSCMPEGPYRADCDGLPE